LIIGSIGVILGPLLNLLIPGPLGANGPGSIPSNVFVVVGAILVLVGLPAFYRSYAEQMKTVGKIGVGLVCAGIILALIVLGLVQIYADLTIPSPIPSTIVVAPPLGVVVLAFGGAAVFVIGGVIVGIKMIRGSNSPRWIGWMLIIGSIILFFSAPIPNPVLSTAVEVVGFVIFFGSLDWAAARIGSSLGVPPNPAV